MSVHSFLFTQRRNSSRELFYILQYLLNDPNIPPAKSEGKCMLCPEAISTPLTTVKDNLRCCQRKIEAVFHGSRCLSPKSFISGENSFTCLSSTAFVFFITQSCKR